MCINKAVVIDPRFPPKEVLMDKSYDNCSLINCERVDKSFPSYFSFFTDSRGLSHRTKHAIPDNFDSSLCLVYDEHYLKNKRSLNKICSDLYSACRAMPWPILGIAIVEHCSLEQLWIMYNHIPVYLAQEFRIEDKYKQIILSRDSSAYNTVLENLDYYS